MTVWTQTQTESPATQALLETLPIPRGLSDEVASLTAVESRVRQSVSALRTEWQAVSPPKERDLGGLDPDCVVDLLEMVVDSGGKRLRPRMTHWGWVAAAGARTGCGREDMITIAAALELLHAFALVHDDVMDEADSRRGRPSVHAVASGQHRGSGGRGAGPRYGESIAILVGDLLHSEADALAAQVPVALRAAWRTMSIELISGQTRDLVGAANGRRDLTHARQVARAKSGAYTVWRPLQFGAIAAGASAETLAALQRFGEQLGEAFALRDDLLGVLGDPARTGKPVGDDLIAGKPSVLLALAEQRFGPSARLALRRAGNGCSPEQAAYLTAELVRCGVVDEVEQLIRDAVLCGERALDHPAIEPEAALGLRQLAHRVAWRNA